MIIRANGIVISARKLQEGGILLRAFTQEKGVIVGYFRQKNKFSSLPNYGDVGNLTWKIRLEEHLGYLDFESVHSIIQEVIYCKYKALILDSLVNLLTIALPEQVPYHQLYDRTIHLLQDLKNITEIKQLMHSYVKFELLDFLPNIGFGLDLTQCAVTGSREGLHYISPKSAAAISYDIGLPYHEKLFQYPALLFKEDASWSEIIVALKMGSYFLNKNLFQPNNKKIPYSRTSLETSLYEYN